MKKPLKAVLVLSLLCVAAAAIPIVSAQSRDTGIHPVAKLDLQRYQGTWYEIARFPNRFQKKCVGGVSAEYQAMPDGTIGVLNSCRLADGKMESARGVARIAPDEPRLPSKLKVRFAPKWLSWLPLVWGNYWVVLLDPDYRYAAVSEPNGEDLWILSRTPHMDDATYDAVVAQLQQMGLDTAKLNRTPQP